MSEAIVTPSPASVARRMLGRAWDDPDSRSVLVGLLAVLLIHLLLFLLAPHLFRFDRAPSILRPHSSNRQFNIEITPETFAKPPPKTPPPKQFVETNPDAPENIPDKTNNFAAQNQQVAQPKATPNGESERPAMEGKKDFQSTQIVSGRLQKPVEQVEPAPTPPAPMTPPSPAAPRAEQNPLPGFEKTQGDNPSAFGTAKSTATDNIRQIPERIEGEKNVPLIEGATAMQPTIDPKHPRSRPSLVRTQQVRPAVLAENKVGTSNVGVIAINAKFSQYGLYLQRLVEAVQIAWEQYLEKSQISPPPGTYVIVKWTLNSKGEVVRFVDVENHSTPLGAQACQAAITSRAPYGEWTDDMIATLNPEGEELVFSFYYE